MVSCVGLGGDGSRCVVVCRSAALLKSAPAASSSASPSKARGKGRANKATTNAQILEELAEHKAELKEHKEELKEHKEKLTALHTIMEAMARHLKVEIPESAPRATKRSAATAQLDEM